jgi:predicted nucleic acid-binding protein
VAVVTRPKPSKPPLLSDAEARTEVENLLVAFPVLFPTEDVVRTAIRGAAVYRLPWFDAHMWAFAEVFGLDELLSEDFQDGRLYGRVRARNPFA